MHISIVSWLLNLFVPAGSSERDPAGTNVYNEAPGLGNDQSKELATAMENRANHHKISTDKMLDNLMFNGDSHEKKMTEMFRTTDHKPKNEKYPGHKFSIRAVATNNYREFINTSPSGRNNVPAFKTAVRATVNQLTFHPGLSPSANDSWTGNGKGTANIFSHGN